MQLGELEVALDIAESADSEGKWRQLSELAMSTGKLEVSFSHSSAQLQDSGCLTMGKGGWGIGTPKAAPCCMLQLQATSPLGPGTAEGPAECLVNLWAVDLHGGYMPRRPDVVQVCGTPHSLRSTAQFGSQTLQIRREQSLWRGLGRPTS